MQQQIAGASRTDRNVGPNVIASAKKVTKHSEFVVLSFSFSQYDSSTVFKNLC